MSMPNQCTQHMYIKMNDKSSHNFTQINRMNIEKKIDRDISEFYAIPIAAHVHHQPTVDCWLAHRRVV